MSSELWVNMVESYPEPPESESAFNQWYDDVHLPDCLEIPGFVEARRYVANAPDIVNGRGKYLTINFIETNDIDKTMALYREKLQGRQSDLSVNLWNDLLYRQLSIAQAADPREQKQRWINMVETNCDPTQEEGYNHWYNDIHLPDTMETPEFVEARRYMCKPTRDGRGKYLCIYEIESSDIEKTMAIRLEQKKKEIESGRGSDLWRGVWGTTLYKQIAVQRKTPPNET